MTVPIAKVEVGFDLTNSQFGPFLRLNDPVAGQLDDPSWTLGGTIFVDVTDRVRSFNIQRGRNSDFDNFTSGQVSVDFNNHDRAFDPLYEDSPFYGNIVPRREIRIYSDSVLQFTGFIVDWNLAYLPNGDSTVTAIANDSLSVFAGQTLPGFTPDQELTGARIDRILNLPDVNWSLNARNIDIGGSLLGAIPITADDNALQYLQLVAKSEPGNLFIAKNGNLTFTDRALAPNSASLVVFGSEGIPFQNVSVVYGSESLYNEIVISRVGGGTATAADLDSQLAYGIRNLTQTDLLFATDEQSLELALSYARRYSEPEYRFESIEIAIHKIEGADLAKALGLELGSICKIAFTPNGIGNPIERFIEVTKIEQSVKPDTHYMTLGFQAIDFASLVLDDAEFGRLNVYALSN